MTEEQRRFVQLQVREAYEMHQHQWAAYLELCLKVNELPR